MLMNTMQPQKRRLPASAPVLLALAALLPAAPPAAAAEPAPPTLSARLQLGPDAAAKRTPSDRAAGAAAARPGRFCAALRRQARRGGRASGLFVMDAETNKVLCRYAARRPRILASNMKLFTTATALSRFGPDHRFKTRVWRTGRLDRNGVLHGNLYLVGGGDPMLSSPIFGRRNLGGVYSNIYRLARPVRRGGVKRVTGRVFADPTIFDRRRGVPDSGYATSPYIGPLSGLSFNMGFTTSAATTFSSSPEQLAALKLTRRLRASGVRIALNPRVRALPRGRNRTLLGTLRGPVLAEIAEATNVYSVNFLAEMLMKNLGAEFRRRGSTAQGAAVVEAFAKNHHSGVHAADGSGLTRTNRASPAHVGRLIDAMREIRGAAAFIDSLAIAGREGTIADRMEGTAAAGRCHAKTGTISGVSALSGLCRTRSGRRIVFSVLNNGVSSLYAAHAGQDRVAALIARR